MTQLIPCGSVTQIQPNIPYALPVTEAYLLSDQALTFSTTLNGTYDPLSSTTIDPGRIGSGGFIKSAVVANVVMKRVTHFINPR